MSYNRTTHPQLRIISVFVNGVLIACPSLTANTPDEKVDDIVTAAARSSFGEGEAKRNSSGDFIWIRPSKHSAVSPTSPKST